MKLTRNLALLFVFLLAFSACSASNQTSAATELTRQLTLNENLGRQNRDNFGESSQGAQGNGDEESAQILELWEDFWDAWNELRLTGETGLHGLRGFVRAEVEQEQLGLIQSEVTHTELDSARAETRVSPKIEVLEETRATLEDCVLVFPWFNGTMGMRVSAEITREVQIPFGGGGGLILPWRIEDLELGNLAGCVPEGIATSALNAYQEYWSRRIQFFDPPDPNSPSLEELLANPQRDFTKDFLEDYRSRGISLRGSPSISPGIASLLSFSELTIVDCQIPSIGFGLFDIESNERLPDIPVVRQGQRDLREVTMILEEGSWKISEIRGDVDSNCGENLNVRYLPIF